MSVLERYLGAGREAGCPSDQMQNFMRAGVVLQPRQLAALPGQAERPGWLFGVSSLTCR